MCNKIIKWKVEFLQRFVLKSDSSTIFVLSILTNLQYFEYFWGNLILSGSDRNNKFFSCRICYQRKLWTRSWWRLKCLRVDHLPRRQHPVKFIGHKSGGNEIQVIWIVTWLTLVLWSRHHVALTVVVYHGKSAPCLVLCRSQRPHDEGVI